MPQVPNRSARKGAKRSTFSDMADALYPDSSQDDSETEDEQDSPDAAADTQDDAPDGDGASRTPARNMADSLYPNPEQDEPDANGQDADDTDEADQEDGVDSDESGLNDDGNSVGAEDDKTKRNEMTGKQRLREHEPVRVPTPGEWEDIIKIAQPMREMTMAKDPAKALLYGHNDHDYEKRTGKKGQISELQEKLGINVTGVYDTRTKNALESAFVQMMLPWAEKAQKETGVPALVTIGQAWLESGHGLEIPADKRTGISSNNLFGMKQRKGHEGVTAMTKERNRNTDVTSDVPQQFEVHKSLEDSVMQHAQELRDGTDSFRRNNPHYATMVSSKDPAVWAQGLEKAGYATAKNYAKALTENMNQVAKVIDTLRKNKP